MILCYNEYMVDLDEIHPYENFLAEHDPEMRRSLGAFYTPQPAVSYIVRAVDDILQHDFKLRDGLADTAKVDIDGKEFHRVQILDPATGIRHKEGYRTGLFQLRSLHQFVHRFAQRFGSRLSHLIRQFHVEQTLVNLFRLSAVKERILFLRRTHRL